MHHLRVCNLRLVTAEITLKANAVDALMKIPKFHKMLRLVAKSVWTCEMITQTSHKWDSHQEYHKKMMQKVYGKYGTWKSRQKVLVCRDMVMQ